MLRRVGKPDYGDLAVIVTSYYSSISLPAHVVNIVGEEIGVLLVEYLDFFRCDNVGEETVHLVLYEIEIVVERAVLVDVRGVIPAVEGVELGLDVVFRSFLDDARRAVHLVEQHLLQRLCASEGVVVVVRHYLVGVAVEGDDGYVVAF